MQSVQCHIERGSIVYHVLYWLGKSLVFASFACLLIGTRWYWRLTQDRAPPRAGLCLFFDLRRIFRRLCGRCRLYYAVDKSILSPQPRSTRRSMSGRCRRSIKNGRHSFFSVRIFITLFLSPKRSRCHAFISSLTSSSSSSSSRACLFSYDGGSDHR